MSFAVLLPKMFVLFCFLAVGVLSSRAGYADGHTCKGLNKIVLNICAPAMVFSSVLTSEYTYAVKDILELLLDDVGFNAVMLLVAFAATALFCRGHPDRGTYQFMISFGNCVFMGFPVIAAIYGNSAVFLGAVCSMPFNVLSFSAGIVMISGGWKRGSLRTLLVNPPFLANIVAFLLFLFPVRAPEPVLEVLSYLGNMVVPLSMLLIGASLSAIPLREVFSDWRVYAMAACKLIAAPLAVCFICRFFVREPLFLNILVISAAMPSATVSQILATEYGGNAPLASKGVFVTTLCSLITIPVLLSMLLVS